MPVDSNRYIFLNLFRKRFEKEFCTESALYEAALIKLDKYLDLARELKMLWNMKEIFMPISAETLGTIPNLEKKVGEVEIRERIWTIQTTALQKSACIFEVSCRSEATCC